MASNIAISAHGTLLAVISEADAAGYANPDLLAEASEFETIADLRDQTPPPLTRNTFDTSSHNYDEETYVVGIKRTGEMTTTIGFVPSSTTHRRLRTSWTNARRDIYRITFPDGAIWMFSGFVTNLGPAVPVDGDLTADLTLRPTGRKHFIDEE